MVLLLVVSVVVVVSVPSIREVIPILFSTHGVETLKSYMISLGYWGPVVAILLMVLHSVIFIPSEIILFANIYVYGFWLGLLYTWVGSMLGAYFSFYLARLFGKPLVEKVISIEKYEKFNSWFEKNGTFGLFILRLIPLFSFNLLNYGAGLVRISFWQFTWSTALGIIPPMVVIGWLYINSMNSMWGLIILIALIVGILAVKLYKTYSPRMLRGKTVG